jgi:hypothetical protein
MFDDFKLFFTRKPQGFNLKSKPPFFLNKKITILFTILAIPFRLLLKAIDIYIGYSSHC